MSAIQAELEEVCRIRTKPPERRATFLKRLARYANAMTDDEWEALTPPAQLWAKMALDSFNRGSPIPDFPDYVKPYTQEDGIYISKGKVKIFKKPRENNTGICEKLKTEYLKHPDVSNMGAWEKVKGQGYQIAMSSVQSIRSDMRQTIKLLLKLGLLDKERLETYVKEHRPGKHPDDPGVP